MNTDEASKKPPVDTSILFREYCQYVEQNHGSLPETLLEQLYGHYKQATVGDAPNYPPSLWTGIKAQRKYKSWKPLKGMTPEHAMSAYVQLVWNHCQGR